MDENNECSKDHRGDGSLWFWDSQEQLSRERHFWEEASETTTDTKSLILKIIPLHLMNPRQAKRLDNQDMSPHGPSPRHSPSTPLNMRGECIPFRPPSLDLK